MYNLNVNFSDSYQYPLISLLLFTLLLWYQGVITAFITANFELLTIVCPFPVLVLFIYIIIHLFRYLVIFAKFWRKGCYINYYAKYQQSNIFLIYLLGLLEAKVVYLKLPKILTNFLVLFKYEVTWFIVINPKRITLLLNSFTKVLYGLNQLLMKDPIMFLRDYIENFFRKAMFCNTVTFWLFIFYYRVYMGLEIQPKIIRRSYLSNFLKFMKTWITKSYTKHRVSPKTRQKVWFNVNEDFYKSFFFVKRFKKLNDLIWQDGFLIDFLQKKVIDKWIRGFIIYSANLFSERLLFDCVIRFYIDFIFRPISRLSIYEFTSATNILLINIQILFLTLLLILLVFASILLL